VLRLLADPARAAALGARAQQVTDERYGARAMVARLERLYTTRLEAQGRRAA
jgi:hypothetical protein